MSDLALKCQCGAVSGVIHNAKPSSGNRIVCYCKDCQAFANHVNPDILNDFGGTEIFQIPPSLMELEQGTEQLACLRLSEKGLYRWYTRCCNTPIGNTVGLNLPFVGVIHSFMAPDPDIDTKIGPVLGAVHRKSALADLPKNLKGDKSEAAILFRVVSKFIGWKLLARGKTSPFFDQQGQPVAEPTVVK